MITLETFRKIALAFPDATEEPHFEKTSFRVKKKIFATYDAKTNRACLKLSELQQDLYAIAAKEIIYPVPNKWGKQGWTLVELSFVKSVLFKEAVSAAYEGVAGRLVLRNT